LCADVVQTREHARQLARGKTAYKPGDQSPAELDAALRRETPRLGLWLDTSAQAVAEIVEEILGRFQAEAEVATALRPPAAAHRITAPAHIMTGEQSDHHGP
jgi:hypothetical protein